MEYWTAFIIGLTGSVHCIGMCGPIALALPNKGKNYFRVIKNLMLYNFGRVVTYSLLGAIIGLVGKGLFLAGSQSSIAIGLGVLLLIIAVFSIDVETKIISIPFVNKLTRKLQKGLSKLLKIHSGSSLFLIGFLNGFLPCGLVYFAIAGALTTGSLLSGTIYMVVFGLGTIPMMLSISLAGNFLGIKFRNFVRKLYPVFLIIFAILFILRGLNFDVPIDTQIWLDNGPMCH